MIVEPSAEYLRKKVGSTFSLVNAVAKRARQLNDGNKPSVQSNSKNTITIASKEIMEGKVTCKEIK